jgi:hypothetical protein
MKLSSFDHLRGESHYFEFASSYVGFGENSFSLFLALKRLRFQNNGRFITEACLKSAA